MRRFLSLSPRWTYLLIALAALAGMALVAFATSSGPGVGGDATIYLTSAKNLLAGRGLGWTEADGSFRLLPYTPPFYPLSLSFVGLFASDLVAGARWFNVLLFGATITLTGLYLYRSTGQGWLAVIAAGLVAFSPVIIGVQVWAMSESLFLLLCFGGLFALVEYLYRPRPGMLIAAALLSGLAFLTRYMGAACLLTGGLALLVYGLRSERRLSLKALKPAFFYSVIAVLPMLVWILIDMSTTGTVSSRSGQPASAYGQRLLEMYPALESIVLFWLVPDSVTGRLPGILRALGWLVPLAGVLGLGVVLSRRANEENGQNQRAGILGLVLSLFIAAYLLVLAVVQVFTYPPVTLAARMLSPVHMAFLILVAGLAFFALEYLLRGKRIGAALVWLALFALLGTYVLRGGLVARRFYGTGIGYNAPEWQESETVAAAKALPANVPLISNETTALMYFADRPAYTLQEIFTDKPQTEFTVYGAGADESQRVFRQENGALVLFYNTLYEDYAMYGEQADERIAALTEGLYPYFVSDDGAIYFYQKPSFAP